MNGLWSVSVLSIPLYLHLPLVKGTCAHRALPFPSLWRWTMPYMQRLTRASPAGLISLCFNAGHMRTISSPGNCMPTLQRHGRNFRKPCLIGAAPGEARPSVCWLSAELEQEIIWEQNAVVSPLTSFGASSCPARLITCLGVPVLCNDSEDFGKSVLCLSMTQTDPAGVQLWPA